MNYKYVKEKAYIYYMTSNLPIRVFDEKMNLIVQAGVQPSPYAVLDNPDVQKFHQEYIINGNTAEYCSEFNEQYMFVQLSQYNKLFALIGPYKHEINKAEELPAPSNQLEKSDVIQKYYNEMSTIKHGSCGSHIQCLNALFDDSKMIDKSLTSDKRMNFDEILMEYREIDFHHHNYLYEVQFFHHYLKGRLSVMDNKHVSEIEMAIVSEDHVRSLKNIVIVNIAVMGRYVIERGLSSHISFSIGDEYIRRLEKLNNLQNIVALVDEVFNRYKEALDKALLGKYSKKIKNALQYIDKNLSIGFTLEDVAEHIRLHPNYLSTIFKKEVGLSFTDYVLSEKIQEAKMLLKHSNYTLSEISGILNFGSKSYFIKCFRKLEGVTPVKYIEQSVIK